MAEDLGVSLLSLDIEIPEQLKAADKLVEEHGDWSEDYLVPQVFVEYADGKVNHVLTGFSEAVSVTEVSWKAFFSSAYYHSLVHGQTVIPHSSSPYRARASPYRSKPLKKFVEKYLTFQGRCYRHCDQISSFMDLRSDLNNVIAAYVCPDGYVSRVAYFSVCQDVKPLKSYLCSQVGEEIVADRDIRPATRHGWELGNDAMAEIGGVSPTSSIQEVYWTVYPKTEDERNRGVFVCSYPENDRGCNRLFVQHKESRNRLCPKCKQ